MKELLILVNPSHPNVYNKWVEIEGNLPLIVSILCLFTDNRRKCLGNIEEVRLNFLLNKLATITENLVDVRKLSLAMLSNWHKDQRLAALWHLGWQSEGKDAPQRGILISHTHDSSIPNLQLSAVGQLPTHLSSVTGQACKQCRRMSLFCPRNGSKEVCHHFS